MKETNRTEVNFRLKRAQILYDADNNAYIEGNMMPDETGKPKAALIDITQDGNIDRVNRVMNLAVSECREMLYPYSKQEIQTEDCDNEPTTPEEYVITAAFPEDLSQTTVELIANLLHEYVTGRVLSDWLSITKPESAAKWYSEIESIKLKLKQTMSIRRKKLRRGSSPF